MNYIELGKFLANLRQEKGLTQEKLAEILNIDKRKISRWETGISTPEFDMLIRLTEIFDITLYELSIGKRIKNKKIREKAKEHFKNISDYHKYSIKRIIITLISVIIGLLLGLSAIFTIENYQKTKIYNFYSIDNKYEITGNYIKISNYEFIHIIDLKKDGITITDSEIANNTIYYEIQNHQKETLAKKEKIISYDYLLFYTESYNKNINLNEKEIYTFILSYYDSNKIVNEINFEFKINKKFSNELFYKMID